MRHKQLWSLLLATFLVFSSPARADDSKICAWTKQILLSTLSIDYTDSDDDINKSSKYYTANAWEALNSFLGSYINVVRSEKLTLHPVISQPPTVVATGTANEQNLFPDFPYWQIYLPVYIPELKLDIAFSMLVIATEPEQDKYLIQSISMEKKLRQ